MRTSQIWRGRLYCGETRNQCHCGTPLSRARLFTLGLSRDYSCYFVTPVLENSTDLLQGRWIYGLKHTATSHGRTQRHCKGTKNELKTSHTAFLQCATTRIAFTADRAHRTKDISRTSIVTCTRPHVHTGSYHLRPPTSLSNISVACLNSTPASEAQAHSKFLRILSPSSVKPTPSPVS